MKRNFIEGTIILELTKGNKIFLFHYLYDAIYQAHKNELDKIKDSIFQTFTSDIEIYNNELEELIINSGLIKPLDLMDSKIYKVSDIEGIKIEAYKII